MNWEPVDTLARILGYVSLVGILIGLGVWARFALADALPRKCECWRCEDKP